MRLSARFGSAYIMLRISSVILVVVAAVLSRASGQDYGFEVLNGPPTSDEVPAELIEHVATQGYKVTRDSNRTVCEIWLGRQLELVAGFEQSEIQLYPFRPGQIIGLMHFPRRSSDFRNQTVESGWYTLRYELQPVDGNHVGTSPTRDFLLMVRADNDQVKKTWNPKELVAASAEVAGSSHPAMLCLQSVDKSAEKKAAIRHNEEKDWWVLRLVGKGVADNKPQDVLLDLVVAGHAEE